MQLMLAKYQPSTVLFIQLITMFLRWIRTPPMPGIECLGEFVDFRKSRFPEIWKSGNLNIRVFSNPGIRSFRKTEFWDSGKSENQDFRSSDVPDFRKVGKSEAEHKPSWFPSWFVKNNICC